RAVWTEFGVVLPNRAQHVRRGARAAAEALPELARRAVEDLRAHLGVLDERIAAYDRELEAHARASEAARRLMQIRGIGPLTAVAMVATVGNARVDRGGLGLSPSGAGDAHHRDPPNGHSESRLRHCLKD